MQSENKHSRKLYTPEVIVIDEDNDPDTYKTSRRPRKSRKHKKTLHIKNNREVKVDKFQDMETLVVTQKVKLKKQKFKCIINLTSTHKSSEKPKSKRHSTIRSERIVPQCLRKCSSNQNTRSKQEKPSHAYKKTPKPKHEISSELYEDVSSDSFTSDDIDILIKRTKDRDRQLSKSFSSQCSQNVNTSMFSDISDTETSILRSSDKDSTTTLVIAPKLEIYSPTRPTTSPDNYFYMNENKRHRTSFEDNDYDLYSRKRQFSPTLPYDNKFYSENNGDKVSSVDYQHSCMIKNEPYSPSEEPVCCNQERLPYEVHIKCEDTEMDDLTDKTKNRKSLDLIEGSPKIKVEGGLYSPATNCVLPEYDQRYTNQSNRTDRHGRVKIEKDVNGNDNENSVYIKSETIEHDYCTVKIKEE